MTQDVFYTGQFTTISVTRLDDSDDFDCDMCPEAAYFDVFAESAIGHHSWFLCDMCRNHCN